jgi:uncharacterized protein (TIGR02284 family)
MAERSEHAVLNRLIETCRDGERGFRLAAEQVKHEGLKALFTDLAAQRRQFVAELLPHAQRLGGDAPGEGTGVATLHRGWMTLEGAFGHNDHVILGETERGDRATLRLYADAVNGLLPPQTRDLVQRQLDQLEEGHARMAVRAPAHR